MAPHGDTHSAAMASWAQIKEGLGQANNQLTAETAMTAEIVRNVFTYLAAIADTGNKMESDHSKMNVQVTAEFVEVMQKILMHQGALEILAAKPEKAHTGGARGVLENKSVTNLPTLGTDKNSFRNWNDRMVNAVVNVRPGTRKIFQSMMEHVDQEKVGNFEEVFKESQEYQDMVAAGTT